jgi:CheY-like chemotaxis protein
VRSLKAVDVLLVEDNPADVRLIEEALCYEGRPKRLTVARDGAEALEILRGQGAPEPGYRPHLILLDLNLPRRSGREVLAEVKADPALRTIPVIVLTTSDADEDVQAAYGLQANSYVVKPVGFDEFTGLARALEEFWLQWARLPKRR